MTPNSDQRDWVRELGAAELKLLAGVLGKSVLELFAPELRVRRFWCSAPCFSLSLGEGEFLSIESDWADTPKHALDYHEMVVAVSDHPKDVPRVFDDKGRKLIGSPVSVVEIGAPKSPIVSITVLEHEEAHRSESVRYDSGLIFELADGRRFAIMVHQSIAGGLECATEPVAIEEVLAEDRVRLVLK